MLSDYLSRSQGKEGEGNLTLDQITDQMKKMQAKDLMIEIERRESGGFLWDPKTITYGASYEGAGNDGFIHLTHTFADRYEESMSDYRLRLIHIKILEQLLAQLKALKEVDIDGVVDASILYLDPEVANENDIYDVGGLEKLTKKLKELKK